jgi:hypothetical protein
MSPIVDIADAPKHVASVRTVICEEGINLAELADGSVSVVVTDAKGNRIALVRSPQELREIGEFILRICAATPNPPIQGRASGL